MPTATPSRRKLATLRGCDIWRDGGSYSAVFTTSGGEGYRLWLDRHPSVFLEPDPLPRHRFLFEGWGYDTASELKAGIPILTGSPDEQDILDQLQSFLLSPRVEVPFAHKTPGEHYLETLRAMVEAIPLRAPFFAGDLSSYPNPAEPEPGRAMDRERSADF